MPKALAFDPGKSDLQAVRLYDILRRDGVEARLTDADHDVTIGGVTTYLALPNVQFSSLAFSSDGTANLCEITGILEAGGLFDPGDIALGKFASAVVGVRLCDLSDVSVSGFIFGGVVADLTYSEDQTSVTLEVRSNLALAKVVLVETYGALCRADFGDYKNPLNPGRCKLPVLPDDILRNHTYAPGDFVRVRSGSAGNPTDYANRYHVCLSSSGPTASTQPIPYHTSLPSTTTDGLCVFAAQEAYLRTVVVATIVDSFNFTISDPADPRAFTFALGWIAINGNYDICYEVKAWDATTKTVTLWMPLTGLLEVGDIIDIAPGCDKRLVETCAAVFDNAVNNRSEA